MKRYQVTAGTSRLNRRTVLQVGALGGLGLTLSDLLRSEARGDIKDYQSKEGSAKSVIHIFLPGGSAHQETFDPKPYAPIEYRGEMGTVKTKLSGIRYSEMMKKTADIADKITVIRSMSHGEAAHERGTHNMFTGYRPSPALKFPSMGSIVSHEFGPRENLPPYVCIPNQPNEFAGVGYLSSRYAPFSLGSDPARDNFSVRDLSLPSGVDDARFSTRRRLLDTVNDHFRKTEQSDDLAALDTFYERAYSMISSEKARAAFDLSAESDKLREQYGKNQAGQRMLMARRLVEAGVRFVTLTYGGWDHHARIKDGITRQVPDLDQAFATLIRDLDDRGMLDSTLVVISSEFGRTPKINKDAGRDHWPRVFSTVLAGGGIKRGVIYGESNATASEPEVDAVGIEDFAKTIYHCLGIEGDKELMAPGDRPIEIVDGGRVLDELLA